MKTLIKTQFCKIIFIILIQSLIFGERIKPELTLSKKRLIILSNDKGNDINQKIIEIVSNTASQLDRYNIIDRSKLDSILEEQKLQHSGIVDQNQVVEIGKISSANEALFIRISNFGQKGVPKKEKEDDKDDDSKTGIFGWVVKEVVKAGIEKKLENVERYPNNIHTIIDIEASLINIESGETISSFYIRGDHIGGIKEKSLSSALEQIRSQFKNSFKKLYKLKSEILDINGKEVMLLLGRDMGVSQGTVFEVSELDEKKVIRNREIIIPGKSVGLIKVYSVSNDASKALIIRKWTDLKPGYQVNELIGGAWAGGVNMFHGSLNNNIRLSFNINVNPFGKFDGLVQGNIGVVSDSRNEDNFQVGFGIDFNYRIIKTVPFSFGGIISLPFDFHFRSDDGNSSGEIHTVVLPVFSPRIGMQTELMITKKIDLVLRAEYVLSSIEGEWSYSEDVPTDDHSSSEETQSIKYNANWDLRGVPEITYNGWMFGIGIKRIFFTSIDF